LVKSSVHIVIFINNFSGAYSSFIDALLTEAEIRKNYLAEEVVSTIYLGGGTLLFFR